MGLRKAVTYLLEVDLPCQKVAHDVLHQRHHPGARLQQKCKVGPTNRLNACMKHSCVLIGHRLTSLLRVAISASNQSGHPGRHRTGTSVKRSPYASKIRLLKFLRSCRHREGLTITLLSLLDATSGFFPGLVVPVQRSLVIMSIQSN